MLQPGFNILYTKMSLVVCIFHDQLHVQEHKGYHNPLLFLQHEGVISYRTLRRREEEDKVQWHSLFLSHTQLTHIYLNVAISCYIIWRKRFAPSTPIFSGWTNYLHSNTSTSLVKLCHYDLTYCYECLQWYMFLKITHGMWWGERDLCLHPQFPYMNQLHSNTSTLLIKKCLMVQLIVYE